MGDGKTRTPMSSKEWLAFEDGVNWERARVSKFLDEHVAQFEIVQRLFGFSWKQRCRCGFYGVFNKHLTELMKGETK